MKNQTTQETAKRTCKRTNDIIEDHGDWLLVDISTNKFPDATMAVDADVFKAHEGGRIWAHTQGATKYIYAKYTINGKKIRFHRDVIDCSDIDIDHIDHGSTSFVDNRRSNLRVATKSQNMMNKGVQVNNTSGIKGVYWHKSTSKWVAEIGLNGKSIHLGLFDNIDFAIGARQQAERELFGEFTYSAEDVK